MQFEQAIADLLHDLGYSDVKRTGGAGDLNVDVWARDPQGKRVAVQCKQYGPGHSVGSPDVQTFIGMMFQHHGADRGIFATTSAFTAPAASLAKEHNIWMLDSAQLAAQLSALRNKRDSANAGVAVAARSVVVMGLPLGLFLLAHIWEEGGRVRPPTRTVTASSIAIQAPVATASATGAALAQLPLRIYGTTPTPPAITSVVYVANTDGEGVYIRHTPALEDKVRAYQDGTALVIVGPDENSDGIRWHDVRAPDGTEEYVPAQYTTQHD